jgi:quinol-cytochrome oxidoreductase complex cytochrome b subunit
VIEEQHRIVSPYSLLTLLVPIAGLVFALAYGNLLALNYVHVITGGTWTGIDLFMGLVMSRVMKGLEPQARTQVIKKLVPVMLFLMPSLASVAITSGINMAGRLGLLTLESPAIIAAIVIVIILSVQGFGMIMPTEARVYLELRKKEPDRDKIIKWGMRNIKLAGSQGIFQVALIFVMANLALGFV